MITTQLQLIFYGQNFKTSEEISFGADIALEVTDFFENCVKENLIQNKRLWSWDPENQIETTYLFSDNITKARDFQKKFMESDVYRKIYNFVNESGYQVTLGMINFNENEDTRYDTIISQ